MSEEKKKAFSAELSEMDLEQVNARLASDEEEVRGSEDPDLIAEKIEQKKMLLDRKSELEDLAKRTADAAKIAEGSANVEVIERGKSMEEKKMFGPETKEYRDAFMANLVGRATEEQRAILADNTNYGDGLALPSALDERVWDQIHTEHPILADVKTIRSGMPIKVTKMTPAAITKKMDSATTSEQTFTSAEVVLVGADYHTYVPLSYAEAKMSQGAMEDFLVGEVADAIGEALAKDVFARVLSDAGTGQKVTPASGDTLFTSVKAALALATQAGKPVIYAPATSYYEVVGAIAQGSPYNMGHAVGVEVKLDNAATKVTVLDPRMFVLNVIQDTIVESQKDVKDAAYVISGYARAEGCLRKTKAAAYIN